MAELTYRQAVAAGLAQEIERDRTVMLIGEDIGAAGGVFKATEGLFERFGPARIWDTPISEQAIVGTAMGAAMTGIRPVAEIMFSDFLACCWDYLANEIPKVRYMTGGQVTVPLEDYHAIFEDSRIEAEETSKILQMSLDLLPKDQREALVLQVYGGLSYLEIAEVMGVPMTTVRNWIVRAKDKMRKIVAPYFQESEGETADNS